MEPATLHIEGERRHDRSPLRMSLTGQTITCEREWLLGDRIGSGGFGQVYAARTPDGDEAAVKLVPVSPGADRELLFVELGETPNVVPIIESCEYDGYHVLVMPIAECSLRQRLDHGELDPAEVMDVLRDVADALVALDGRVVHRDLKPANLLRLAGIWCLADFGIARYAEATTAPETQKFALSPPYAAPERWRNDRASSATDVYALGIIAFEMITGDRPFGGPSLELYREQHLQIDPPRLDQVPAAFGALVEECLYKAPEARPRPANLRARLEQAGAPATSEGLARLQEANRTEVTRRTDAARRESAARTAEERRQALFDSAKRSFGRVCEVLLEAIQNAAPSAVLMQQSGPAWMLTLNAAQLAVSLPNRAGPGVGAPSFDVIAVATLNLRIPADQYGYEGGSHSLWFGDIQHEGDYGWYETAFMFTPLMAQQGRQDPFALDPGEAQGR